MRERVIRVVQDPNPKFGVGGAEMEKQPATLSLADVAQLLDLGYKTVWKAAHRGELPVIKIGRQYRVVRSHLDQMLADAGKTNKPAAGSVK